MAIKLGPILKFQQCNKDTWHLSVLVVTDAGPAPGIQGGDMPPQFQPLPGLVQAQAWRADLVFGLTAQPRAASYTLAGFGTFEVHLPAAGAMPCMAYASCNGFSDPKLMKQVKEQNAMWGELRSLHDGKRRIRGERFGPYHLMLLGGDQVYSDSMWQLVPSLREWSAKGREDRQAAKWTGTMEKQVTEFYETLYLQRWAQPAVANMMAAIPSVMMWDDHDIFDGWGSYPEKDHFCPVYQGIFGVAKRYFSIFQQHCTPGGALPPAAVPAQAGFSAIYRIGKLCLLALDMRSERQPEHMAAGNDWHSAQVLSNASWDAVYGLLEAQFAAGGIEHLVVMSSIPVVHPSFGLLESLLDAAPGQQELEDDLRDHWSSPAHRAERLRLVKRLSAFADQCSVSFVSGDVHLAALGQIERPLPAKGTSVSLLQLTSSGVVHPPPPAIARYFLEQASKSVEELEDGMTARMVPFPDGRRLIGARNILTLEPGSKDRLWANWWLEGIAEPAMKAIGRAA
jgi:hypothetical protein